MQLTKVTRKFQVTIPRAVRKAAGVKLGDLMEVVPAKEGILLRRKLLVDYRSALEEDLAKAEADLKAGRVLGPFDTADEVMQAVEDYKREKRLEGQAGRRRKPAPGAVKRRTHARAAHA